MYELNAATIVIGLASCGCDGEVDGDSGGCSGSWTH